MAHRQIGIAAMLELVRAAGELALRGEGYELRLAAAGAQEALLNVRGTPAASLFVPASCDADGETDVVAAPGAALVREEPGAIVIEVPAHSRLWGEVRYCFRGTAGSLEHFARRQGDRRLDDLRFFAGRIADGEERHSTPHWRSVFDPEPNARRKHYFGPDELATIGVSSDPSYYKGNWFFTPGPLCYSFELGECGWLGAGIAAAPGANNFDHFAYRGTAAGFGFHLSYNGHVRSERDWESPHLLLFAGGDEFSTLASYVEWLRRAGLVPQGNRVQHDWWWEPIFCGWGEQVTIERRTSLTTPPSPLAADLCTQDAYDRFLMTLRRQGLYPGTTVIDDKWQQHYGLNHPDPAKWPDLPGFIAAQHDIGRRVLLWLRAWSPEGVLAAECLRDSSGTPLAVDPSSPAYEARLRAQVRHMLLELGADGFKIDFTHRLPTEAQVQSAGGIWGIELLKRLLAIIHGEAKRAKPDALIMAHAANPYFADVVDMLRLNDVPNIVGQPGFLAAMETRAKVARIASPHWIIDTDNWPSPSREAWLEYTRAQPALGVPSLYYATSIYHFGEDGVVTDEPLRSEDYAELAALWAGYRQGKRDGPSS